MSIWQYNAWCDAYQRRTSDVLALHIQGAYLTAYWTNAGKKGKSLQRVLQSLQEKKAKQITDFKQVDEQFSRFEELKKHGRTQYSN